MLSPCRVRSVTFWNWNWNRRDAGEKMGPLDPDYQPIVPGKFHMQGLRKLTQYFFFLVLVKFLRMESYDANFFKNCVDVSEKLLLRSLKKKSITSQEPGKGIFVQDKTRVEVPNMKILANPQPRFGNTRGKILTFNFQLTTSLPLQVQPQLRLNHFLFLSIL